MTSLFAQISVYVSLVTYPIFRRKCSITLQHLGATSFFIRSMTNYHFYILFNTQMTPDWKNFVTIEIHELEQVNLMYQFKGVNKSTIKKV